jgi:hypothetical protein
MSYPKKHPATSASQVGVAPSQYGSNALARSVIGSGGINKDERYVKRREQLLNLLVNKFRGKYISSVGADENNVDRIIRTEVSRFLEAEHMTEGNLVRLDQRIADLLENGGKAS